MCEDLLLADDKVSDLTPYQKGCKMETKLMQAVVENKLKIKMIYISRSQLVAKEEDRSYVGNTKGLAESLSWGGSLLPLTVTGMECGKYLLLDGKRRLTAIDSVIANPECRNWNDKSRIPVFVIWKPVVRRFRIYGENGRRQEASLRKSFTFHSLDNYTKCTLLCSDRTGTKRYAELVISGPKWYSIRELNKQFDSGVFQNCKYGKIFEIINNEEVPLKLSSKHTNCWNSCKGYACKEKDWVSNLTPRD